MGIDSRLGKKTLFRIAMTEVRDAGFSGEKEREYARDQDPPLQTLYYGLIV